MKPTSIVSLIVAVLLVIAGLVTCFMAQNMAQANGEFLFSEERNDDLIQTVDLTESEISKIELIAENATVNIIGRAEKSYIEFINFRENYYALSATNRILSFDEIPDVMSMLKFWENGFSFKGMRYILNFREQPEEDKQKVINVYLESGRDIKIFDINIDTLTLNIENMTTPTDYNIITDTATITTNALRTTSSFNINADAKINAASSLTMNMKTALLSNLTVRAKDLQMQAESFRCNGVGSITCDSGAISIATVRKVADTPLSLTSESGILTIEGASVLSPYTNVGNEDPGKLFTIQSESADIIFTSASGTVTPDA